jgi:hypothetical protein
MGLFNLLTNTVEGALQSTIGAAKVSVGLLVTPIDEGTTLQSGMENMRDGMEKIGNSEDEGKGK